MFFRKNIINAKVVSIVFVSITNFYANVAYIKMTLLIFMLALLILCQCCICLLTIIIIIIIRIIILETQQTLCNNSEVNAWLAIGKNSHEINV